MSSGLWSGRSRTVRAAVILALAAILGGFVGGWALPNVAGAAFVSVRPVVQPVAAAGGASVSVSGGTPVRASALAIGIEIVNSYPLSVVVGSGRMSYQATVYTRDSSGRLVQVWVHGADDPALEEGSDSPDVGSGGLPSNRAAVVAPGMHRFQITTADTVFLLTGKGAATAVYYLQVWAFGISSGPIAISVNGATDPAGVPASLPQPPDTAPPYPAPLPS